LLEIPVVVEDDDGFYLRGRMLCTWVHCMGTDITTPETSKSETVTFGIVLDVLFIVVSVIKDIVGMRNARDTRVAGPTGGSKPSGRLSEPSEV
jgi:hypothetical protein